MDSYIADYLNTIEERRINICKRNGADYILLNDSLLFQKQGDTYSRLSAKTVLDIKDKEKRHEAIRDYIKVKQQAVKVYCNER